MDAEAGPLLPALSASLASWRRRGRLADLLPPLLLWCNRRWGSERALLLSEEKNGGFRIWGSRTIDDQAVPEPEKCVSNFALMRATDSVDPVLFDDTRSDRRFRTEAEVQRGLRSRSILVAAIVDGPPAIHLYLDSRFRVIECPAVSDPEWTALRDVLALGLLQTLEHRQLGEVRKQLRRREKVRSEQEGAPRGTTGRSAGRVAPTSRPATTPLDFHGFLTRHRPLMEELEELSRLAVSDVPILLEGESGTGKELLARAVHEQSGRRGRFLTLHCATLTDTLVEVELFGHLKGAFTGADRVREGLLAHAAGGTIFLDAVEEATPTLQGALLRVLETGRYRPLGGEEEIEADVRFVSSLLLSRESGPEEEVLRSDLYYRLAGARVLIPPLRERREDILPTLEHLIARQGRGAIAPEWAEGVEEALVAHDWPGNAREMWNLTLKLAALGEETLSEERLRSIAGGPRTSAVAEGSMRGELDRVEREGILRALHEAEGNKSAACRILGWSRRTLYRRMQKHGIPL
ncbi:MAG: sigma 54-interacting transcriptional regulator [Planctomycetota bacterium]